jgi:methyl-accepting chemotaxis protein
MARPSGTEADSRAEAAAGEPEVFLTLRRRLRDLTSSFEELQRYIDALEGRLADFESGESSTIQSGETSLLAPLLDATKMALKLVQANDAEFVSGVVPVLEEFFPEQAQPLRDLQDRLDVKLSADIEERSLQIVGQNRKILLSVADLIPALIDDIQNKTTQVKNTSQRLETVEKSLAEAAGELEKRKREIRELVDKNHRTRGILEQVVTEYRDFRTESQELAQRYQRLAKVATSAEALKLADEDHQRTEFLIGLVESWRESNARLLGEDNRGLITGRLDRDSVLDALEEIIKTSVLKARKER